MKTKRMRSLFWRIFLSLWLGSTLLMVGTSLLIAMIAEREVPEQVLDRVGTLLRGNAYNLLQLYTRVDQHEFAEAVAAVESNYNLAIYFIDDNGRELLDRPLPAALRRFETEFRASQKTLTVGGPLRGGALMFAERMRAPDGREYRVMGSAIGTPPLPSINLILRAMLAPLFFSVLLAGLFSAMSARYLVVPINDLRRATRQLAAGDLDSRVGAALRERTDEFGALAADFDRMADRIGALIGTQRQLMLDLSHELRSPLARLRVALELMRDQPHAALLDRMERDTDRMDILIGELLLLARLESPASELSLINVDLGELLSEIVDDARLEIAGQPRALRFEDGHQCMVVDGDRELLRRALENVIRNALQHTSTSADVTVTLAPDGADALIHVIDGGAGFSADALSRLFAPFARGESPRQQQGNGLGLAIARAAVQRHGGSVEIGPNVAGTGAVVDIRLPLYARMDG